MFHVEQSRPCARCGKPNDRRHYYCRSCFAAYMRGWRKVHRLTPEQRRKDCARSYAGVYKRRGLLVPQPCESCEASETEMHHPDYDKPIDVRWLCRPCHLAEHEEQLAAAA